MSVSNWQETQRDDIHPFGLDQSNNKRQEFVVFVVFDRVVLQKGGMSQTGK